MQDQYDQSCKGDTLYDKSIRAGYVKSQCCFGQKNFLVITIPKYESINKRFIELYSGVKIAPNGTFIEKIKENPWSYHYQAAIELFLKKPIFGHGIKSFRVKCLETNIDKKTIENNFFYKEKMLFSIEFNIYYNYVFIKFFLNKSLVVKSF